jgi:cyanophycinase-like exopeptidase
MRPDLLGVGIDEDTALVIERGEGIEVIGQGTVTLVDPSQMQSNVDELEVLDQIEMLGVQLTRCKVSTLATSHPTTGRGGSHKGLSLVPPTGT